MNFIQQLKIRNYVVEKSNVGIKHGSYQRVLQKRYKDHFVKSIGNKKNECLCKSVKPIV